MITQQDSQLEGTPSQDDPRLTDAMFLIVGQERFCLSAVVIACLPSSLMAALFPTGSFFYYDLNDLFANYSNDRDANDSLEFEHPNPGHPRFSPLFDPQSPRLGLESLGEDQFVVSHAVSARYFRFLVTRIREVLKNRGVDVVEGEVVFRQSGVASVGGVMQGEVPEFSIDVDVVSEGGSRHGSGDGVLEVDCILVVQEELDFYVLPPVAEGTSFDATAMKRNCGEYLKGLDGVLESVVSRGRKGRVDSGVDLCARAATENAGFEEETKISQEEENGIGKRTGKNVGIKKWFRRVFSKDLVANAVANAQVITPPASPTPTSVHPHHSQIPVPVHSHVPLETTTLVQPPPKLQPILAAVENFAGVDVREKEWGFRESGGCIGVLQSACVAGCSRRSMNLAHEKPLGTTLSNGGSSDNEYDVITQVAGEDGNVDGYESVDDMLAAGIAVRKVWWESYNVKVVKGGEIEVVPRTEECNDVASLWIRRLWVVETVIL
ncbi:hypothetical protein HDU79_007707 [Rhizoclosmatium sp. JEL0117]|nr:hypothetical protein HDU79_007707 [Rhizoclosmatium sp. JEL0117]